MCIRDRDKRLPDGKPPLFLLAANKYYKQSNKLRKVTKTPQFSDNGTAATSYKEVVGFAFSFPQDCPAKTFWFYQKLSLRPVK